MESHLQRKMVLPCPYPEGQNFLHVWGAQMHKYLVVMDLDGLKVPWQFYFTEVTSNPLCFYVLIFKTTQHCQDGTLCTFSHQNRQQS